MSETQKRQNPNPSGLKKHAGGCHCGAVRFEAELDLDAGASRCNCTVCTKMGNTGVMVAPSAFRLLSGEESLGEYRIGTSLNARRFCKRCGVQVFGQGDIPELRGPFVSVNVNCLDDIDPGALKIGYWDGRHNNWQAGMRNEPWPVKAA
jgi:hypothetical protein